MNKSEKIIVRTIAFLISLVISVSTFGFMSSWAWTHLDPEQQEIIGAINAPWFTAQRDQTSVSTESRAVVSKKTARDSPATTTAVHTR